MKVKIIIELEASFKSFKDKKLNDLTLEEIEDETKYLVDNFPMYPTAAYDMLRTNDEDHPEFDKAGGVTIKVKKVGKPRIKIIEK